MRNCVNLKELAESLTLAEKERQFEDFLRELDGKEKRCFVHPDSYGLNSLGELREPVICFGDKREMFPFTKW